MYYEILGNVFLLHIIKDILFITSIYETCLVFLVLFVMLKSPKPQHLDVLLVFLECF